MAHWTLRFAARGAQGSTLLLVCLALGAGCALLEVKEQRATFERLGRIHGEVRLDVPSDSPIVVVLGKATDDPSAPGPETGDRAGYVIDHYRLERAGAFAFVVAPGTFRLAAFADQNRNLVYDPGEPALANQPLFDLTPGQTLDGVELVIPHAESLDRRYDILALESRAPKDQEDFSLGRFTVWGEVADLDDPKFGPESGKLGMWRFVDFLFRVGPGIYFLEPYDPKKIPVLFVHGIQGYPQQFGALIERLDRDRFQPWFYFYPSGIHLDSIARHLTLVVAGLEERYGFDEMALVAHSMGGLVARAFLLDHAQQPDASQVRAFVAISTPWGGSPQAAGVEEAPQEYMVYSWLDMSPESPFLKGLFYQPPDHRRARPLPASTRFDMIFGYRRREDSFGASGDGTVEMRSEARLEAILAARTLLPLDDTHVGILEREETAARVDSILREVFD